MISVYCKVDIPISIIVCFCDHIDTVACTYYFCSERSDLLLLLLFLLFSNSSYFLLLLANIPTFLTNLLLFCNCRFKMLKFVHGWICTINLRRIYMWEVFGLFNWNCYIICIKRRRIYLPICSLICIFLEILWWYCPCPLLIAHPV